MATTIHVKDPTKERLNHIRLLYEKRFRRNLTFDDVINLLIDTTDDSFVRKRKAISELFGILNPDPEALARLRQEGEKRLEVFLQNNRE